MKTIDEKELATAVAAVRQLCENPDGSGDLYAPLQISDTYIGTVILALVSAGHLTIEGPKVAFVPFVRSANRDISVRSVCVSERVEPDVKTWMFVGDERDEDRIRYIEVCETGFPRRAWKRPASASISFEAWVRHINSCLRCDRDEKARVDENKVNEKLGEAMAKSSSDRPIWLKPDGYIHADTLGYLCLVNWRKTRKDPIPFMDWQVRGCAERGWEAALRSCHRVPADDTGAKIVEAHVMDEFDALAAEGNRIGAEMHRGGAEDINKFLQRWAEVTGQNREEGESDSDFRNRMAAAVANSFKPKPNRGTHPSLAAATAPTTGLEESARKPVGDPIAEAARRINSPPIKPVVKQFDVTNLEITIGGKKIRNPVRGLSISNIFDENDQTKTDAEKAGVPAKAIEVVVDGSSVPEPNVKIVDGPKGPVIEVTTPFEEDSDCAVSIGRIEEQPEHVELDGVRFHRDDPVTIEVEGAPLFVPAGVVACLKRQAIEASEKAKGRPDGHETGPTLLGRGRAMYLEDPDRYRPCDCEGRNDGMGCDDCMGLGIIDVTGISEVTVEVNCARCHGERYIPGMVNEVIPCPSCNNR